MHQYVNVRAEKDDDVMQADAVAVIQDVRKASGDAAVSDFTLHLALTVSAEHWIDGWTMAADLHNFWT